MPNREQILQASNDLEKLTMVAKQIVDDLREDWSRPYARVYWLRREMSRIVATLGEGVPQGLNEIEAVYRSWMVD